MRIPSRTSTRPRGLPLGEGLDPPVEEVTGAVEHDRVPLLLPWLAPRSSCRLRSRRRSVHAWRRRAPHGAPARWSRQPPGCGRSRHRRAARRWCRRLRTPRAVGARVSSSRALTHAAVAYERRAARSISADEHADSAFYFLIPDLVTWSDRPCPTLPAFRRSFSRDTGFPSPCTVGLLKDRILAATCPTTSLSVP